MHKFIFTLLFTLPFTLFCQDEGSIIFVETTKLEIEIPEEMKEMAAKFPKERTNHMVLSFKKGISMYRNHEKIDDDIEMESGSGNIQFQIKMSEPDNRTLINHNEGSYQKKQELMGKNFFIKDVVPKQKWKLGKEKRSIHDYICMSATAQIDDETTAVAWFTTQIPHSMGPDTYAGLPGMILAIEINNGEQHIVAREINLHTVNDEVFDLPEKGKKVNQAEFDEIREKKMKEMNAKHGGRGVRIITHTVRNDDRGE